MLGKKWQFLLILILLYVYSQLLIGEDSMVLQAQIIELFSNPQLYH